MLSDLSGSLKKKSQKRQGSRPRFKLGHWPWCFWHFFSLRRRTLNACNQSRNTRHVQAVPLYVACILLLMCHMHVSSSSYDTCKPSRYTWHVSSSSCVTCMYPPPHMTRASCPAIRDMYPPPHVSHACILLLIWHMHDTLIFRRHVSSSSCVTCMYPPPHMSRIAGQSRNTWHVTPTWCDS
jgi:hypothetical protein